MGSTTAPLPNRSRSVADYRQLASTYDASCRRLGDIRTVAMNALALQPGQTVFDIACGTGATLLELSRRVGAHGKVVGIDHSPEMAAFARHRIATSGAKNIELLVEPIESARVGHQADALLLSFAHDVLQSRQALHNVFSMTRHGARVVTVGAKLVAWWWAAPLNGWIHWRGRRYRTTERGLLRPWDPLKEYCPDIHVMETFNLGTSYVAEGTYFGDIASRTNVSHSQ